MILKHENNSLVRLNFCEPKLRTQKEGLSAGCSSLFTSVFSLLTSLLSTSFVSSVCVCLLLVSLSFLFIFIFKVIVKVTLIQKKLN